MSLPVENFAQISVKMGSHRFNIDVCDGTEMRCSKFIELVLSKCRLHASERLVQTYAVFESLNGVERRVEVVRACKSVTPGVEYVVRKLSTVEAALPKKPQQQQLNAKKCYRKLRHMNKNKVSAAKAVSRQIEVYEDIDEDVKDEVAVANDDYMSRIVANEIVLRKQAKRLAALEESIRKRVECGQQQEVPVVVEEKRVERPTCRSCYGIDKRRLQENLAVLRNLYAKLKATKRIVGESSVNNKSFSSTSSRVQLIESGMNSCGNSSSDENEMMSYGCGGSKSRSSSTSTLESLV